MSTKSTLLIRLIKLLITSTVWVLLLINNKNSIVHAADEDPLQDICVANGETNYNGGAVSMNGRICKATDKTTAIDFVSTLLRSSNVKSAPEAGKRAVVTRANVETFPGLNTMGISVARADFAGNGGFVQPHVHPRASEVLFVLQGTLTVGFVSSAPNYTLFQATLQRGDLFVFPRSLPQFQINLDDKPAISISVFNSQLPGVNQLALALLASDPPLPSILLRNTLGIDQVTLDELSSSIRATFNV